MGKGHKETSNHEEGEEHRLILVYYTIIHCYHCYCFCFDFPSAKNLSPNALESARGSPKLSAAPEIRSRCVHVLCKVQDQYMIAVGGVSYPSSEINFCEEGIPTVPSGILIGAGGSNSFRFSTEINHAWVNS